MTEELFKRKLEPEEELETFLQETGSGSSGHKNGSGAGDLLVNAMKAEDQSGGGGGLGGEPVQVQVATNVAPPAKRFRGTEELDIRFLISSKEAGAIIGKGGANINHLRKHYKSSVTVPDCPGPERVLSIVTSLDSLTDILNDIIGYIDDQRQQKGESREVELRMLIHTSHAGGIIGRGGQRIRELRDETKAAIKVFSQCCPMSTERVCAIQGAKEIVVDAIRTVLDVILTTPIKGAVKLYDPFNFDVYVAGDYGGFTEPGPSGAYRNAGQDQRHSGGGAGGRSAIGGSGGGGGRGVGGGGNDSLQSRGGWPPSAVDSWSRLGSMPYEPGADRSQAGAASSQQMYQRWMPGADGMAGASTADGSMQYWSDMMAGADGSHGMATNAMSAWQQQQQQQQQQQPQTGYEASGETMSLIENPDGSVTASLLVPNSVAGAIIGKGGNRIRTVRQDSGADVSIDSPNGPSKDRQITIKGSRHQVRLAYTMLQNSITDNATQSAY